MISNITKDIKNSLSDIYSENEISSLSRIIIEEVTGIPLAIFLSDKSRKITEIQRSNIKKIIDRLLQQEPIQYILGTNEFFGLHFEVNKDVLIPRPETEELVELILSQYINQKVSILDIGTGSGCIAIALKKNLPQAEVSAWDFSAKALSIAKKNALNNKVEVNFEIVDVLQKILINRKFDLIVSNPPYVLESEKQTMNKNVLDYEPHSALFVPDDQSLIFYERIADIGSNILNKGGKLFFEINQQKGFETKEMLEHKNYKQVKVIKDMACNNRIVEAIFS